MSTEAVAYGKLILLGEHAVVYDSPALVLGISRKLTARAERAEQSTLRMLDQEVAPDSAGSEPLSRAFAALLEHRTKLEGLNVEVTGDVPPGVGMGFSAAAAVAVARAVLGLCGERAKDDEVRKRAMAWEGVFHGNPSGVDVAAAMHGGCLRFHRNKGVKRVAREAQLTLCVGLTGTRSSTRDMVEGVASLRAQKPELVDSTVAAISSLVDNAIASVEDGNVGALGELMNLNQMLLAGLMLSNDSIETMCSAARDAGAMGAKLTGAGGGGAVVALVGAGGEEAIAEAVIARWNAQGFDGFRAQLGGAP